uniref:Uncharacterized protein n=1 Tax=Meloidogyne enterolobii TaxID=390850 RepID=A0A6V7W5I9_MELEN|nr:unnamed protein product [Meloidogyne enterolobii]
MHHKNIIIIKIIFLFAISTTSVNSISKTKEDIAEQKILKELEQCSSENYDSASKIAKCNNVIDFIANISNDLCTGPAKLLSGTIICKGGFSNYAMFLEQICGNTYLGSHGLWCSNLENKCCLKRAHDAMSGLYPSCKQLSKVVTDLPDKLCKMSKEKALEYAHSERCRSEISLITSKSRETCHKIFAPNYVLTPEFFKLTIFST